MKKKLIKIILPDKIKSPVGGLGVQCKYMIQHLQSHYDFEIIGQPEENGSSEYYSVTHPLPKIIHGSINTLIGQGAYYHHTLESGNKPDLIHAYDWSTYLAGVYAAKHYKVPLIVTMQLSIHLLETVGIVYSGDVKTIDGLWLHNTHKEIELSGLRNADHIVHVSNSYANSINQLDPSFSSKYSIVPNGIELSEWNNYQKVKLPGNRPIKLVYIGRFAMMKGVIELLQSYIPDNIDLIFIGTNNGGEAGVFESMLKASHTRENIHFIGPAYNQDKINILKSADAMIVPSIHEPFGIVALEALASENILLSSYANGMSDFLTEDVALNCGNNPNSISNALQKLSTMGEEEKKNRISKGLQICEKYSWENASLKMKPIYDNLLKI